MRDKRGTLASLGRDWVSRRRETPPHMVGARDPLSTGDFATIKRELEALTRASMVPAILGLDYYRTEAGHTKILDRVVISSYPHAKSAYSAFVKLCDQLSEKTENNPLIKTLVDSGAANGPQIDDFYRSIVRLLTIVAQPTVSLKNKQIALDSWDYSSLNDNPSAQAHRAIVQACRFDQDGFVWSLRSLIMQQALIQAANRNPLLPIAELHKATEALIARLWHRTRWFQIPMTKAKQFQLLEDTANFVIELLDPEVTQRTAVDIVQRYQQKIARMTYPPTLKALFTAALLALIVLVIMMGLQVALASMTPIAALSMINILATAGSAAHIWATATMVLTAVIAVGIFLLPRYALYPTTRFKALFAAANKLSEASATPTAASKGKVVKAVNPLLGAARRNAEAAAAPTALARVASSGTTTSSSLASVDNPLRAAMATAPAPASLGEGASSTDAAVRTAKALGVAGGGSQRFLSGVRTARRDGGAGAGAGSAASARPSASS